MSETTLRYLTPEEQAAAGISSRLQNVVLFPEDTSQLTRADWEFLFPDLPQFEWEVYQLGMKAVREQAVQP